MDILQSEMFTTSGPHFVTLEIWQDIPQSDSSLRLLHRRAQDDVVPQTIIVLEHFGER